MHCGINNKRKERKKTKNKQVADVREEETEEPGGAERGRELFVLMSLSDLHLNAPLNTPPQSWICSSAVPDSSWIS